MLRISRLLSIALTAATLSFPTAYAAAPVEYPLVESPLLEKAPVSGDFWMGSPNAKIKFIEYASLSCTHCAHFHKDVLPVLKEKYIDTGKMTYILRPFPLNESALEASKLIDCIGEAKGSEQYYVFARVLFDSQSKWAFDMNYLSSLETFAKVGGVSKGMFNECLKDSEREIRILNTKRDAAKTLGVDATPFMFINNRAYRGEKSPEAVTQYIDSLLLESEDGLRGTGSKQIYVKPAEGKDKKAKQQ